MQDDDDADSQLNKLSGPSEKEVVKTCRNLSLEIARRQLKIISERLQAVYLGRNDSPQKENERPETNTASEEINGLKERLKILAEHQRLKAAARNAALANRQTERKNMGFFGRIRAKYSDLRTEYGETYEFFKTAGSALALALFIRSFLIQPFNIPSESMSPTLFVGDYIFVNKFSYGYSKYSLPFAPNVFDGRFFYASPERGDPVVFRVPRDDNKDYIKRIVGLPGDEIQMRGGKLFVNNKAVPRQSAGAFSGPTYDRETAGAPTYRESIDKKDGTSHAFLTVDARKRGQVDDTIVYKVPKDHFFVMGDNRDNSQDSRYLSGPVGFVPKENLIGKAVTIFFSLNECSFFEVWKWPSCVRYSRILTSLD